MMTTKLRFQTVPGLSIAVYLAMTLCLSTLTEPAAATTIESGETAALLAGFLRAGRKVISRHQALINDPKGGDKGLSGERILRETVEQFESAQGIELKSVDPQSPSGKLIQVLMDSIDDVMVENQSAVNAEGVGLKGFLPAVFARLVA